MAKRCIPKLRKQVDSIMIPKTFELHVKRAFLILLKEHKKINASQLEKAITELEKS